MSDAVAPQGEVTPSTTNTQEAAIPTDSPASEAPADAPIFTPEEAADIKKFFDNNGGFEKVKRNISLRKADAPKQAETSAPEVTPGTAPQAQQLTTPEAPAQQTAEPSTNTVPKGFRTPTEIIAQVYNDRLEAVPEYEPIKDYIHSGEYIKEMEKMGMIAFDKQGNVNDAVVRQFLDLKAKTVPAPTTSTPLTSTPLVEYTHTEGDITNLETARAIMRQGTSHPRYNDAMTFFSTAFNGAKPAQPTNK